jgi:hypothetical protein
MNESIKLLNVVALTVDLPDETLVRGQVGTVVGELAPRVFEVELGPVPRAGVQEMRQPIERQRVSIVTMPPSMKSMVTMLPSSNAVPSNGLLPVARTSTRRGSPFHSMWSA